MVADTSATAEFLDRWRAPGDTASSTWEERFGLEMYLPIEKRNATAAELLRHGHAERLMISQDFCATIDWFPPEAAEVFENAGAIRNWSMTLVFDEVAPALRELGVMDDAVFQTIFTENPKRWLTA